MKRILAFVCLLFVSMYVRAQAVSATIVDSGSAAWAYANVSFTLSNPSGQKPINTQTGQPVTIPPPITANASGFFTVTLTANNIIVPFGTQWIPHICPFNPNQQCQNLASFILSGPVDISASITKQLVPVTIGNPFLFPLSHSGSTGQSAFNGAAYYDVATSGLYVRNPATNGYSQIGSTVNGSTVCTVAAPCPTPLNLVTNPTGNTSIDLAATTVLISGTAPAPIPTSPPAASNFFVLNAPDAQGTTGTTGQVGARGVTLSMGGGRGGPAPAGSTNGNGGELHLNGGPPGNGAGTAGLPGPVFISQQGGHTFIGGLTNTVAFDFGPGGAIANNVNFQTITTPLCTIPAGAAWTGCLATETLPIARSDNNFVAVCSIYVPSAPAMFGGTQTFGNTSILVRVYTITGAAINPGDGQIMCVIIGR